MPTLYTKTVTLSQANPGDTATEAVVSENFFSNDFAFLGVVTAERKGGSEGQLSVNIPAFSGTVANAQTYDDNVTDVLALISEFFGIEEAQS